MAATIPASQEVDLEYSGKVAGPCVFVLFGAAGDLTKRKLVPALFNLVRAKLLPDNFAVMGVSVDDLSAEAFRAQVSEFLPQHDESPDQLDWLQQRLFYERGDFGDPNTFARLTERLAAVDDNTASVEIWTLPTPTVSMCGYTSGSNSESPWGSVASLDALYATLYSGGH